MGMRACSILLDAQVPPLGEFESGEGDGWDFA
jgi:hypothetical protein